jgi:ketosteroid isomerase-like protein
MNPPIALLLLSLVFAAAPRAAEDAVIAAVRAADDERIAATIAADAARLGASYSDALHYAHSSGKIDTKASQIAGITTGTTKYERVEYKERAFVPAGPGVMLMKGHVLVHTRNKTSGQPGLLDLNYLAVWRQEGGRWRFLAWQSCKNPAPADAKK